MLINQQVADEIGTLVARHRYGIEDATDAVRNAEQAATERASEIKAAAEDRNQALNEQLEQAQEAEKEQHGWGARRGEEINEFQFGESEPEIEPPSAQGQPPSTPPPSQAAQPRAAEEQARSAGRGRPVFEDEDDFENRSWLN